MLLSNEMFFSGIVREQSVKQVYFTHFCGQGSDLW